MKALLIVTLLFLASCGGKIDPGSYSFEITDEVVSSNLEKDDSTGDYASCSRSGDIAWKLNITPEDFSGLVLAKAVGRLGDYEAAEGVYYIEIIDGKMVPTNFSAYGSYSDPAKKEKICAISDAKQYSLDIDHDSVVLIPGFKSMFSGSTVEAK